MKTNLFSVLLVLISAYAFGQNKFEKGYLVDNDNYKVECMIKNKNLKHNPVDFSFIREGSSLEENGTINTIKEFGIYGKLKYKRVLVKIERSSEALDRLTYVQYPVWTEEKLFLKVIVEGKASLYSFSDGNIKKFFYCVSDSAINQLIYKRYLMDLEYVGIRTNFINSYTVENFEFRQQLIRDVLCADTKLSTVASIKYYQKELEKYFINYNKCSLLN
ncbi:MAG: hypothetical protein Q7U54_20275 [Bacteroidales bacterium]|nr:hypothetical protein [Bacteroidales bacterium]